MIKKQLLLLLFSGIQLVVFGQTQEIQFAFDNYKKYYAEACAVSDSQKDKAILKLRREFKEKPYRYHSLETTPFHKVCKLKRSSWVTTLPGPLFYNKKLRHV